LKVLAFMSHCTRCDKPKEPGEMSWRRGWCKGCESDRVKGYLAARRARVGDDAFKAERAETQRVRRERLRRTT
jgi:hypothetical protein